MLTFDNRYLRFESGNLQVIWMDGAVALTRGEDTLLLDAPPGVIQHLNHHDLLPSLRTVCCSSGQMSSLGGLLPLLDEVHRVQSSRFPFTLRAPMGDERLGLVVEAWSRGWPGRVPIGLDGLYPGAKFEMGSWRVRTFGIEMGEVIYGEHPHIEPCVGIAWRIEVEGETIVWIRSCTPHQMIEKMCKDASLAIVEVGVRPWPKSERRWRLSVSNASQYGMLAKELWLVGDEGGPLKVDLLA